MAVCECLALYPSHVGPDRFPRGSRCVLFSGLRPESCRPVTGPYRVHGLNWIGGPGLDSNKLGPSLPPQVAQPGLAYSSRRYIELPQIVSVARYLHCSFSTFHLPHHMSLQVIDSIIPSDPRMLFHESDLALFFFCSIAQNREPGLDI